MDDFADFEKLEELRRQGKLSTEEFAEQKQILFRRAMRQSGEHTKPKNGIIYILLAWFLGTLGLHNFYAGYYWRGIFQLALTLVAWMFMFVPLLFVAIWVLLELLFVNRDARGIPFGGSRAAIGFLRVAAVLLLGLAFSYNSQILSEQDLVINENLESFVSPEE